MIRIPLVCAECRTPFLVHPYRATTARFCSHRCQSRLHGRQRQGSPAPSKQSLADLFWTRARRATPDVCWIWQGRKDKDGYGHFQMHGNRTPAHRAAYILTHGPISSDMNVCHNCPDGDNPACVNPAHLWLGTQHQNIQDSIRKGRRRPPSNTKLSPADREEICRLYQPYVYGQVRLAKQFGVKQSTLWHVLHKYGRGNKPVPHIHTESARPQRRLTQEQRTEILTLYQTGHWNKAELAACFQTSRRTIRHLLQGIHPQEA